MKFSFSASRYPKNDVPAEGDLAGISTIGENNMSTSFSYVLVTTNIIVKLLFYICIVLQVVIWPSAPSITFASVLALHGIVHYLSTHRSKIWTNISSHGICFIQDKDVSLTTYIFICLMAAYMLVFFMLFVSHEAQIQPAMTMWLHPNVLHNYTFRDNENVPFSNVDVKSDESISMRKNTFIWPRKLLLQTAVRVNGTLPTAGAGGTPLMCAVPGSGLDFYSARMNKYECYAAKLAVFSPPATISSSSNSGNGLLNQHQFVPMTSQFYTTDVIVTPPFGTKCSDLEIYRTVLDDKKNVQHGLDYPASAIVGVSGSPQLFSACNLFQNPSWCLQIQHPFSAAEYTAKVAEKCAADNGKLVIRLPVRALDVDPDNAHMALDTLIVTTGATVQLSFEWHIQGEQKDKPLLLQGWTHPENDQAKDWRESSEDGSVFFKYGVVITPLLILWYYLAVQFENVVPSNQILFMCIFVLLPSVLIFLSVGSWLPMAGSIICVIAINHSPPSFQSIHWNVHMRHLLLFLTAICNSIQFAWIMDLISEAGWSAFLYDDTLHQLSDKSSKFIINGNPIWIALLLPLTLTVNVMFLVGSAICIALELLPKSLSTRTAVDT